MAGHKVMQSEECGITIFQAHSFTLLLLMILNNDLLGAVNTCILHLAIYLVLEIEMERGR
jgi:hypothetical protein